MITLHRLGQAHLAVRLNCDLVLTIEANPDTVVSLVTGARLVVSETPDEVVQAIRDWRAEVARHTFGVPAIVRPEDREAKPSPTDPGPVSPRSGISPMPAKPRAPGGLHSV